MIHLTITILKNVPVFKMHSKQYFIQCIPSLAHLLLFMRTMLQGHYFIISEQEGREPGRKSSKVFFSPCDDSNLRQRKNRVGVREGLKLGTGGSSVPEGALDGAILHLCGSGEDKRECVYTQHRNVTTVTYGESNLLLDIL